MQIDLPNDMSELTKEQLNNLKVVMCQLHTFNETLKRNMEYQIRKYALNEQNTKDEREH